LEALFPGSRHALLRVIFLEPERWWTMLELKGRIEDDAARLRREAAALAAGGVLLERKEGRFRAWRANPDFPFFAELQAMAARCARQGAPGVTILIVDDEPATAKISRILLESWGYRVLVAHTAEEALALFDRHQEEIQLLLADVVMPGVSGPQLALKLRIRKPDLRILFMSGGPEEDFVGHPGFLAKPFNPAGLARKIREELDT